jgi:hypothetical protein
MTVIFLSFPLDHLNPSLAHSSVISLMNTVSEAGVLEAINDLRRKEKSASLLSGSLERIKSCLLSEVSLKSNIMSSTST